MRTGKKINIFEVKTIRCTLLSQSKLVWEAFTKLGLGSIDLVARK